MTLLKNERVMIFLDSFTAADLLILIIILFAFGAFMFKSRNNVKNYLEAYRLKKNSKEKVLAQITTNEEAIKKLEKHHEDDKDELYQQQLAYRQQSLDKQAEIDNRFLEIGKQFEQLTKAINCLQEKVEQQHKETQEIKKNELREKLLGYYRDYASIEKNPEQEWSEIEAETFWNLFEDYSNLNGNGFMHTHVKPAMLKLKVIPV